MAQGNTRDMGQARLIERAMQDPAFRAALKTDPRAAIEAEFGMPIPENVVIDVLEETPAHYYVVLPAASAVMEGELPDEALEVVAGGKTAHKQE